MGGAGEPMIVTSAQFSLKPVSSDEEFWGRVEKLAAEAVGAKSELMLFPEYFSLSWVLGKGNFREAILGSGEKEQAFLERFQQLAEATKLAIVAGTIPHLEGEKILNRAWIFRAGENPHFQDKANMTRFEAEEWLVQGGAPALQLFRVRDVLCAVAICYDVEFPSYCAAAAEAGVELLLVPSCTDDVHGYWRVRHCAEARAVENQCYVLTSSIVEGDPARPEIAVHYGQGGIFSPCDLGFPESGVLGLSPANVEGLVTASLDFRLLKEVRRNGTVLNLRDSSPRARIEPKR
jgi:predicted amidohydrolase